jgi:tetratricopeptide (TPR) repeat protein
LYRPDKHCIYASLGALLVAILYASASWNNQFVYDDHEVIENQFPLHNFQDLKEIFSEPHYLNFPYYRPLTRTTFAAQKAISGFAPRPYHLFNAILAAFTMLAAYALLRRSVFKLTPFAALLASLWVSLHPAFSESVYPAASGRETLLPAFLILLSTWAYLGQPKLDYWLANALFIAALLSKEQAAVLPAIFILSDLLLTPRRNYRYLRYLPPLFLLAGYFFVRHLVFHAPTLHWDIQNHPAAPLTSLLYGLQSAVVPFMTLHYEPALDVWLDPVLTTIALFALIALIVWIIQSGKTVRTISLFWLGWFILVQLPTAHIFRQEAPYSERYVALALPAIAAIGALLILNINRPLLRRSAAAVSVGWIAVLAFITSWRATAYTDDTAFAVQWSSTNPTSAGAHAGLGLVAQQKHNPTVAIEEYRQALQFDPDSRTAHNNLANLLADQDDFPEAAYHYRWLLTQNPDDISAMTNYAQMLAQQAYAQHNPQLAAQSHAILEQAIKLKSTYAQAHYILAIWYETFGSKEAAIAEFQKALELRPDITGAREHLTALQPLLPASQP